jgi:hypothetical protein
LNITDEKSSANPTKKPHAYEQCCLHGTLGAGKSLMLAALACLLMRQGWRVVYIPDCARMLAQPEYRLQFIPEAAHINDERFGPLLATAAWREPGSAKLDALKVFGRAAGEAESEALFIADQAKAHNNTDAGNEHHDDHKNLARSLLNACSSTHMKQASSTSNYKHAVTDALRQTS